jgi:hypothetical protein
MAWTLLEEELESWRAEGRTATLWWRDDDAVTATPALERLLAQTGPAGIPLVLAVVPAGADPALATRLAEAGHVRVVQHGYAHRNHAPPGAKKCELGGGRPPAAVAAELSWGRTRLRELFGTRMLAVLVPPWNRIDPDLAQSLAGLGYTGLSLFGPRSAQATAAGVATVNTHVDPIDWRGDRGFRGERDSLAALACHLRSRRLGEVDASEPTGLLTHHLDHDAAGWAFLRKLAAVTRRHPAVRWLPGEAVFTRAGR